MTTLPGFIILTQISMCLGARLRADLPDLFSQYYILTPNDVSLNYDPLSNVVKYAVNDVFGTTFMLEMREEASVFGPNSDEDIVMCNGTVTNLDNGLTGLAYGTLEYSKYFVFRGQFALGEITFFIEDAEKYVGYADREVIAICYSSLEVILPQGEYEGQDDEPLPVADEGVAAPGFEVAHRAFASHDSISAGTVCHMDMVVDNGLFYTLGGSKNVVWNLIFQQVMTANRVFGSAFRRNTGTDRVPRLGFAVRRLTIADDDFCQDRGSNIFCQGTYLGANTNSFLANLAEEVGNDKVCLTYIYTNRSLASAMGGAFIGGACHERSNVGFVTLTSRMTPQFAADLFLAHALGHSLGAKHDSSSSEDCFGTTTGGKFLMASITAKRQRPNNLKFSKCSRQSINSVLDAIQLGRTGNCFRPTGDRLEEIDTAWYLSFASAPSFQTWTILSAFCVAAIL